MSVLRVVLILLSVLIVVCAAIAVTVWAWQEWVRISSELEDQYR